MSGTTSIVPAWLGGSLVMMRSTETLTCQIKCEVARGDDLNIEQAKVHAAKVLESVLSLLTFAVGMDRNPDQIAQAYEKHGVSAVILAPAGLGITVPVLGAGDVGETYDLAIKELAHHMKEQDKELKFMARFGVPYIVGDAPSEG